MKSEQVGARVKEMRKALGMKQGEWACRAGSDGEFWYGSKGSVIIFVKSIPFSISAAAARMVDGWVQE